MVCGLAVLLAVNFAKGFDSVVQGWGRPYWWLSYHDGFVRRGLAGEVFQRLFGRLDEAQLARPLEGENLITLAVLAGALFWPLLMALRRETRPGLRSLVLVTAVWAFAAQFWPTIAYNEAYLDSLVLCWAVAAALLLRAGRFWAAAALLITGPLLHEYFLFLVPMVLMAQPLDGFTSASGREVVSFDASAERRMSPLAGLAGLAALAVLSTAAVVFLSNPAAAARQVAAMPLTGDEKAALIHSTMGQSVREALQVELGLVLHHPVFALANGLFFLAPSAVCAAAMGLAVRPGHRLTVLLRVAAGLAPLAALLVAWDLSRLLVMANYACAFLAFVTLEEAASDQPRGEVGGEAGDGRRAWSWAAPGLAAGLLYATLPLAYVYFPPGPATLMPLRGLNGRTAPTFGVERAWPISEVRRR